MPPASNGKDRSQSGSARSSPNPPAVNRPILRGDTRKTGSTLVIEDQQDIKDALEGRKFLERHSLLCPPGEPPSHESLSICLHQISAMAGIPKQVLNAIRSVTFLIEEMEETQINLTVKEAFDSQVDEFTSDMKTLIEDAKDKIDEHLKSSEERLTQLLNSAPPQPRPTQQNSYASALVNPPPHANPRVAAREGIRARQFMIEGLSETKFSHIDNHHLKTELNKILLDSGLNKGTIRSINNVRNRGILLEMDSDEATIWFQKTENRSDFCRKLGPNVESRTRAHSLIALNVPLTFDPENQGHLMELREANDLDTEVITTTRWVKPVNRRTLGQRTAHLILSFTSADAANRAITNGLYICNKRCYVEKTKREPTRCLKCQGWNHFAKECLEKEDTCSNCAENHRTKDCPTPQVKRCVSCKTDEHASWSRDCPTFIKKVNELNARVPENVLQYIPTAEPWTWTATDKHPPPPPPAPLSKVSYIHDRSQPQKARRTNSTNRGCDTYIPNDTYIPSYSGERATDSGINILDKTSQESLKDAQNFRPLDQQALDTINKATSSNPTPLYFT